MICAVTAAAQQEYRVTVLHSFRVPFEESFGWGIGDGQQVGDSNNLRSGGSSHALLWSGTPESLIDLHPPEWPASFATGVAGGWQSGYVERIGPHYTLRAAIWNGTRDSMVLLHPSGWENGNSQALGISLTDQVGWINPDPRDLRLAARWQGTPDSMVLLHPGVNYLTSTAYDTDGEQQVGVAINYTDQSQRPALWYGTPESFVDLTPPGFEGGQGQAYGVAGGQQVGWAATRQTGGTRAMLWFGSAESYVSLGSGVAQDTNGRQQVGWIPTVGFDTHAAVWSGTPQSRLDLHQFLPAQFQGQGALSRAYAIDAEGNIIG